eukprot:CAMPEP_0174297256 /NCGR_PEP_ID=MMETSP0809-20121228/50491_1 /TAXON_ID=73025 ORGANISM="Eutreptiella gymnastica-like, Strain CCMP1594" /NCGR_SAMPLE_ID=MMETSP0809 /ASSEMBLY_ACC=CAM_ASM_000658 /LENGTH=92 /DNA_ID=CAMNT_0015400925 /DNA_START=101 /DNA_END=379 /DNA_ORIENTATION=-
MHHVGQYPQEQALSSLAGLLVQPCDHQEHAHVRAIAMHGHDITPRTHNTGPHSVTSLLCLFRLLLILLQQLVVLTCKPLRHQDIDVLADKLL